MKTMTRRKMDGKERINDDDGDQDDYYGWEEVIGKKEPGLGKK